jgi:hypothetical protein
MKEEIAEQDGIPGDETPTGGEETKDTGSLSLGEDEAAGILAGETDETGTATDPDKDAEAEGKADKDGEEEKPKKVEFTPEQQDVLEKRIGKEVAKRKELEDRLAGLEAKLDAERSARQGTETALPQNVLAMNSEQLDALEARVDKLLDFCEENPDGTEADPGDPKSKAYTAAEIRAARATYSKMARQIPRAREMARERSQIDATLPERFPELADPRSAQSKQFLAFAQVVGPQFAALPNAKVLFAHMVLGEQVELARHKAAAAKAGKAKTAEEPPQLPIGKGAMKVNVPAAGGKKQLNIKRLVDSRGDLETAVEILAEVE